MAFGKIGKFKILDTLGAGAHSSILRIRRDADGRDYALKMVPIEEEEHKKFLEQAKHEYRIGQMLDHQSLAKVYALETETDWLFRVKKVKLLVEYVPGETLDKVRLLKMAKMVRVFEKIAAGLAHMHGKGVIHADMKPNNVMLASRLTVKVIDYGLAWIKGEGKARIQGTPEYMAPETALHKIVNERTDIYNFGATMYRLATFKLPPVAPGVEKALGLGESSKPSPMVPVKKLNPIVPDPLAALIEQCLAHNAHQRPERMSEIQGKLDELADELSHMLEPEDLG